KHGGALGYVADDLGVAAAADADGYGHASDPAVIDHLNRIAGDGLCRHDDGRRLLAENDVGLDRHANPQRRILWQPQINAESLAGRVALGRDLGDRRAQRPSGESLASQKSLLA